MDAVLLGLSVDRLFSHIAWLRAIRDLFGVEIGFPVVEDPSMAVGRAYGMIDENGADASAVRATYFIDPDGVIRAVTWYPMTVGRSIDEMVRMLAALQRSADGSVLTPAGGSRARMYCCRQRRPQRRQWAMQHPQTGFINCVPTDERDLPIQDASGHGGRAHKGFCATAAIDDLVAAAGG